MFNPSSFVTIAANNIDRLRERDVYRLISECPAEQRQTLARYIAKHRPELSAEVNECLAEVAEQLRDTMSLNSVSP